MDIIQKKMRTLSLNRQGQVEKARLRYVVNISPEEQLRDEELLAQVLEYAPEKIGSSVKSGVELIDYRAPDVFDVAVDYTTVAAIVPDDSKRASYRHGDRFWSSKCTLSKEKCYETLEKQKIFPAEGVPYCEPGHTVAWNGRFGEDSFLDGVEKLVPRCEEYCRKYVFASQCDSDFRHKAMKLVGKTNIKSFHGWSAREVMLSKLEISEPFRNDLDQTLVALECAFSIRRNRSDVTWGGIDVGSVKGWDSVWGTFYANPVSRNVKTSCAYVGRLYESGDFGILGLED